MEPVGIQLPPVISDSIYDHNAGYHPYTGSAAGLWSNRDDSMRAYLTQGPEFESHIRHTGFLPRRPGVASALTSNGESLNTNDQGRCHYGLSIPWSTLIFASQWF